MRGAAPARRKSLPDKDLRLFVENQRKNAENDDYRKNLCHKSPKLKQLGRVLRPDKPWDR